MKIIRQKDIEILLQSNKNLSYKVEILNKDFKVINYVEGLLVSDSLSINGDSDIRRTYNCTMLVTNSNFNISKNSIVWFNRFICPYIGIHSQRDNEIEWYKLGTFLYENASHEYNAETNTLSLTCLDLMALLNDKRGGQLQGYQRTIKAGTDARQVIINILELVGIKNYLIEFNLNNKSVPTFQIPYDLQFSVGMTAYQIMKQIVELYPGSQIFFDVNGLFHIARVPTTANEQYILNDEILKQIIISESTSTSLSDAYNHIMIYGRSNQPNYYSTNVTCSDDTYNANVVSYKIDETTNDKQEFNYDKYMNFDVFALKLPCTNKAIHYININGLGKVKIVDDEHKPLSEGTLSASDNVFRYRKDTNDFLWLGEYQCFGEAIDTTSEYSINEIGDRLKVLSFPEIYTNGLCKTRAEYELYNYTHKQCKLNLSTIAIPFLDINDIIQYTPNGEETGLYIVNSISCNYSEYTMEIELSKYYSQ